MGMSIGSRKGVKSSINITPYIDILLVLLIIFMVISPVRQTGLGVKVPQQPGQTEPAIAAPPDTIVVTVGESAQIAINQKPVDIGVLGSMLQAIYSARSDKNMFISASPILPYGDVVKVIDISKGAGVGDIGLISGDVH